MNAGIYVVVASWEPRFVLGCSASLNDLDIGALFVLYSSRSSDRTLDNRHRVRQACVNRQIQYVERQVDFDDQLSLFGVITGMCKESFQGGDIYVDISTSPRDVSLIALRRIFEFSTSTKVIYYSAEKYGDWLSKEAGIPRILIGSSGIMYPDKPTCVLTLCANSLVRVEQIYYSMEPSRIILLCEVDRSRYGSADKVPEIMKTVVESVIFDHKTFSTENSNILRSLVQAHLEEYNVIVFSTGPKIGVVHLVNLINEFPDVAAAYIPSKYYNNEYSSGLGERFVVELPRLGKVN